jgi:hypothetical protein
MAIWYVITIIVALQQFAFHQHYGAMTIMVALIVEANGTPRKKLVWIYDQTSGLIERQLLNS